MSSGSISAAKVLAYSLPALQAAILLKEKAGTELTAVVEAGFYRRDEQVAFVLATLERSAIKIAGSVPNTNSTPASV